MYVLNRTLNTVPYPPTTYTRKRYMPEPLRMFNLSHPTHHCLLLISKRTAPGPPCYQFGLAERIKPGRRRCYIPVAGPPHGATAAPAHVVVTKRGRPPFTSACFLACQSV